MNPRIKLVERYKSAEYKEQRETLQKIARQKMEQHACSRLLDGADFFNAESLPEFKIFFSKFTRLIKEISPANLARSNEGYQFKRQEDLEKVVKFFREFASLACLELLDADGRLRMDFIEDVLDAMDEWRFLRDDFHSEQVMQAFVLTGVGQISTYACKMTPSLALNHVCLAINRFQYSPIVAEELAAFRQKNLGNNIHYLKLATDFVKTLSASEYLQGLGSLKDIIAADFLTCRDSNELRRIKIAFWLDVMYECAFVQETEEKFFAMWRVFTSYINLPLGGESSFETDWHLLSLRSQNKYRALWQFTEVERLTVELPDTSVKFDNEAFTASLQKYINARDLRCIVDMIDGEFKAVAEEKDHDYERAVLDSLVRYAHSDLAVSAETPAKIMSDNFQKLIRMRSDIDDLQPGLLEKLIKKYKNISGRHLLTTDDEELRRISLVQLAPLMGRDVSDSSLSSRSSDDERKCEEKSKDRSPSRSATPVTSDSESERLVVDRMSSGEASPESSPRFSFKFWKKTSESSKSIPLKNMAGINKVVTNPASP